MFRQYLPKGQRKAALWCAVGAAVTVAGILATGARGLVAGGAEDVTFDGVLDRVEEARARIESVSYRRVTHTESHRERPFEWSPDHLHLTIDVLEQGDLRRSRTQRQEVQVSAEEPDSIRELGWAAVLNDHAIGIRTYSEVPLPVETVGFTDVWELAAIDTDNPAWQRLDVHNTDLLRQGFGVMGSGDLATFRASADADDFRVREIERDGRRQIEIRPVAWDGDESRHGVSRIVEPERGYLITHERQYIDGVLYRERRIEPTLVEDEAGGEVWFPGTVELKSWHVSEEEQGDLRSHTVGRFEDVRVNLPIPEDAFLLPVALEWEEGHRVHVWDEEQPREVATYRGGDLIDPKPIASGADEEG